jgi:hypothetical protein
MVKFHPGTIFNLKSQESIAQLLTGKTEKCVFVAGRLV